MLQLRSGEELREVAALARPLGSPADLDPLIERSGDARYVLLVEASHGTHEYYCWRAWLTQRLVAERGFSFVAVEGDWPDCFDVTAGSKGAARTSSARATCAPMEVMAVPEARPGSHEDLIHLAVGEPCLFVFPDDRNSAWLSGWRDHRAIGVVYEPRRDRLGNWVPTVLGRRYDAFVSFEMTEALHPLHLEPAGLGGEHETYPWTT